MSKSSCCKAKIYVRANFEPTDKKSENGATLCSLSDIEAVCHGCGEKVDWDEANVLATFDEVS